MLFGGGLSSAVGRRDVERVLQVIGCQLFIKSSRV